MFLSWNQLWECRTRTSILVTVSLVSLVHFRIIDVDIVPRKAEAECGCHDVLEFFVNSLSYQRPDQTELSMKGTFVCRLHSRVRCLRSRRWISSSEVGVSYDLLQ